MAKADDKIFYLDENKKKIEEEFTEFELVKAQVEQLIKVVDEHTDLLRANDLVRNEEVEAPYFDDDEVFKSLE